MKGKPIFSTQSSQVPFSPSLLKSEFDLGSFGEAVLVVIAFVFLGQ